MNYGLLNNPILNIGAGLLAAGQSPGGTLGMGLQQGLQNAMRGQQFATQQKLMNLKMDEIQREQKERERQQSLWNNYIGQPAQYKPIVPGSDEEFANFGNLAAVDETGGLLQTQQATGINKYDPGMAQTLGLLGPEKGADFVSQLALQNAKPVTPYSSIGKLAADYQLGRITKDQYEAGLADMQPTGMSFQVGPDGTVSVVQGPGAMGLTTTTQNKLQKEQFDLAGQRDRLYGIKEAFDGDLLRLPAKAEGVWTSFRDFIGAGVSPQDRQNRERQVLLMRRTAENLSQYIKDISGAAVSEQEAERLSKALPTIDDSPMDFEIKLNDSIKSVNRALQRYSYAQAKGLDASGISLPDMERIIENEGNSAEAKIRAANPALSDAEVDSQVMTHLNSLFGGF